MKKLFIVSMVMIFSLVFSVKYSICRSWASMVMEMIIIGKPLP